MVMAEFHQQLFLPPTLAVEPHDTRSRAMNTELRTADGQMPVVIFEPTFTPRGAVVVVQEAFGLNDHIVSIAERLAEAGYVTIAPALFHRLGSPTAPYEDFAAVIPAIGSLTEVGIMMDVDAAINELNHRGFSASSMLPQHSILVAPSHSHPFQASAYNPFDIPHSAHDSFF
jgi:hypothetical protein